jgi:RNA polymerase sigma-70 factor (ECF subfamily)
MSSAEPAVSFREPQFVARLQAKDADALQAVVRAYLDQIYRAARGAGLNQEQAEDATQATFITFLEGADRFEGRSHVRTWLFGILYKKIAETRRKSGREERMEEIDETINQRFDARGQWVRPPRQADMDLEDAELRAQIEKCLEEAPARQRMAFVLREISGLSREEICNALEITVTNLGVLLHRVRNLLRECLEKRGVKG